MGYIRHNAIIAITWRTDAADSLVEYARSLRMERAVPYPEDTV